MANEDLAAEPVTAAPPRTETRFSRPLRYVVRALIFIALIGFLGFILQDGLIQAFMTNPGLNGLIVGALL
ncbi:flagellar motor protein MotA, partial [Bosea sp. CER48]